MKNKTFLLSQSAKIAQSRLIWRLSISKKELARKKQGRARVSSQIWSTTLTYSILLKNETVLKTTLHKILKKDKKGLLTTESTLRKENINPKVSMQLRILK